MKHALAQARLKHFFQQRNQLLLLCALLLILVVLQASALFFKQERIVIVPPDLKQTCWLQKESVSASYLEEMGLFLAHLHLTISPASAAYQRGVILRHTSPSHYGALKAQLLTGEKNLLKQNVSTTFRPLNVLAHPQELSLEITGDFITWVGAKQISCVRETYRLTFSLSRGQLQLLTFQALKKEEISCPTA